MPLPTLDDALLDLRVSGTAQNSKVQGLLNASIQAAANYINRPIPWTDEAGNTVDVPFPVRAAILLELRALFDQPEDSHSKAFMNLLNPYRADLGV